MDERELLVVLKQARQRLDALKEQVKDAQESYDKAEYAVIEHLTTIGAESTAKYEGIGYASVQKPRIYASCTKANEDWLKQYLKDKGRADMIREVVHPQSLSGFVGELVELGQQIPEKISYYLKTSVRLY
jgi:uncharacterized protein YlxW (UPF0749 family)